jgi:hypothetical protein
MKIPGVSFSWKRALGISKVKREIANATGIPTTRMVLNVKSAKLSLTCFLTRKNKGFCLLHKNFYLSALSGISI